MDTSYDLYPYPNDTNATDDDQPYDISLFMKLCFSIGLLMLLVCLVGIAGNLMSVIIFSGHDFRRVSINIFLLGLSAMDLCLLIVSVPSFAGPPISRFLPTNAMFTQMNVLSMLICYPLGTMCQTASVWLLILVTVERWYAVKRPFIVKLCFTRTRVSCLTIFTILIAVFYNAVRFWEFERAPPPTLISLKLRQDKMFMLWYVNVAGVLTTYVVPLTVHCVLSVQVTHALVKASRTRRAMTAGEIREINITKNMGAVVLVFVVCDSFSFSLNIVEHLDPALFYTELGLFLSDLNNLLMVINSASRWIFYLVFSTRYRLRAKALLFRMICRKAPLEPSATPTQMRRSTTRTTQSLVSPTDESFELQPRSPSPFCNNGYDQSLATSP